ncbi:MAG: glycosyltransferase family 4 protein [Magnetospirillum sp.]|nr:glycosyltransferase family 4 protein [Magnetospirillum sp.]
MIAPQVLFLFKSGRRQRQSGDSAFPTEFFYGYCELAASGKPVAILDEDEIAQLAGREGMMVSLLRRLLQRVFPGFPTAVLAAATLGHRAVRQRLAGVATVVATTQSFGLGLCLLRRLGLVQARVAFLVMGVLPLNSRGLWRSLTKWLLGACDVIAISEGERAHLAAALPGGNVSLVAFGVDADFWRPAPFGRPAGDATPYVLSIGNDLNRDYRTLVDGWAGDLPELRIVTRLPVHTSKPNVTVIAGDWRRTLLSDEDVRTLFQGAALVVLPLRQTIQPAGQSACLQAMACGRAVVLSAIDGLWDPRVANEKTCLLVPPGSSQALAAATRRLLADPALAARLGGEARRLVEESLNTRQMAMAMARVLFPSAL